MARNIVWCCLSILAASGVMAADSTVQSLMRQKLESAHGMLDALALEDYGKMEQHARLLRDISQATAWHKPDVPEFQQYAKAFQNSADFLVEQAKAKNLEGVSMGYIRVTLDCLHCHKTVRAAAKAKK